jgi:hypothetical protein
LLLTFKAVIRSAGHVDGSVDDREREVVGGGDVVDVGDPRPSKTFPKVWRSQVAV